MADLRKLQAFFESLARQQIQSTITHFSGPVAHQVNWEQSASALGFDLMSTLRRHNLVGEELRDALVHDYRSRSAEVDAIFDNEEAIELPVVVFAMTEDEAQGLDGKTLAVLQSELGPDLLARYGPTRDDWRPHPNTSVRTSIESALAAFNSQNSADVYGKALPRVEPHFETDAYFHPDEDRRSEVQAAMNSRCFLLAIDPISMFHPPLVELLRDSCVDGFTHVIKVAFPFVSPVAAHTRVEQELHRRLKFAYKAYEKLDPRMELGVTSSRALMRWITAILPMAIDLRRGRRANEGTRSAMARSGRKSGMSPSGTD